MISTCVHLVSLMALSSFTVLLFGRPNSLVHAWPIWRAGALKAALALAVLGHGLSALHYELGTLILDVGMASVWTWAAIFHYQHFLKKKAFEPKETRP